MCNRTSAALFAVSLIVVLFASCNRDPNNLSKAPTAVNQDEPFVASPFNLLDTTHYTPVHPVDDPGGLRIAGKNSSEKIRNCTSINGLLISQLEELMRPGNQDERSSDDGFIGSNEELLAVLVADNDLVSRYRLTHRDLAIPLLQIWQHANAERKRLKKWDSVEIDHAGIRWRVAFKEFKGFQHSPFNDQTKTNTDITLTNLENSKTLQFSGLVPIMIERYGFYEGHGTPYRVEPTDIIEVLGLASIDSTEPK